MYSAYVKASSTFKLVTGLWWAAFPLNKEQQLVAGTRI
jgi:hypothetical protein